MTLIDPPLSFLASQESNPLDLDFDGVALADAGLFCLGRMGLRESKEIVEVFEDMRR